MHLYPKIFFACHTRHVRDPKAGRTLSSHQASILDHLDEVEPTGLLNLARHMGVTPSTMSISIDRLERQGYVVRGRDPRDGRRVCLRLTPAGARIKQSKSVLDPERVESMMSLLNGRERKEAIRGLGLLARAAAEQMARLSPPQRRGIGSRRGTETQRPGTEMRRIPE